MTSAQRAVDPLSGRCPKCRHPKYERRPDCVCCTTTLHAEAPSTPAQAEGLIHGTTALGEPALCGDTSFTDLISLNPKTVTCPVCKAAQAAPAAPAASEDSHE